MRVCVSANNELLHVDDLMNERAKNKLLQEEMEATLHDIQNM